MRYCFTLILYSLLFTSTCFAQQSNEFGRVLPNKLPAKYLIDVSNLREHIETNIPTEYKVPKYERMMHRFSDQQAFAISNLIASGDLYTDWDELEKYVNDVLQEVIPDDMRGDTVIKAYILKDGDYNAFMTPSGHMFVNIGLFAHIEDEAALAAVLAHELAHYRQRHSVHVFFKRETAWSAKAGDFLDEQKESKFSIRNELESDSLAVMWMANSKYEMSGIIRSLRTLDRLEKKLKRRLRNPKLKATSHPLSDDRLVNLQNAIDVVGPREGAKYVVNEQIFNSIVNEARAEVLSDFLHSFRYNSCIEMAFRFHLFDPDNSVYVYYLMESIRRLCYLDPETWSKHFMTDEYYVADADIGEFGRTKMTEHLFEKFDLELMAMTPTSLRTMQGRFYWQDAPKFTTYEEAFEFYYRVAEHLGCVECTLSNALSHTTKLSMRDSLLQVYLSYDEVAHRNFAERLLGDSLSGNFESRKLVIFNDFLTYVSQGVERIPVRVQSEQDNHNLRMLFDSVFVGMPGRIPLFMQELKENNLHDYHLLSELQTFSYIPLVSKGERAELHILEPSYLEFFQRYNVDEIEFVNCIYGEFRKREGSVEAYDEAMNMSYQNIFEQVKRERYMEVFVASVRAFNIGLMKIRHYGGEVHLKFKNRGFDIIVAEIRSQLRTKDKRAVEMDRYFNNRR